MSLPAPPVKVSVPVLLRPYNASLPPWVSTLFGASLMAVPLSSWLLQTFSEVALVRGGVGLVKMLFVASFVARSRCC